MYIYIYICIYPPAPTGHTAVKAFNAIFVSLLSRHPAIYCQISILLSCDKCYSSSIAKVLRRIFWFLCNCFLVTKSHGHVKMPIRAWLP